MNRVGTVYIRVSNLDKQVAFYETAIGLQVHHRRDNTVFLGAGGDDLLALIHTPAGKRIRGQNGLYHFALLLPSRYHLAMKLSHLFTDDIPLQGLSDHLVSEAIYLADPEGNGIEIYADRSNEGWFVNGQLRMATLPLNVDDLLRELDGLKKSDHMLPQQTIMGHIHLHTPQLNQPVAYFRQTLDMALMFTMPSAAFLSYDSYHHHIGVNTWAGAISWADDALGLDHFTLIDQAGKEIVLNLPTIMNQSVVDAK